MFSVLNTIRKRIEWRSLTYGHWPEWVQVVWVVMWLCIVCGLVILWLTFMDSTKKLNVDDYNKLVEYASIERCAFLLPDIKLALEDGVIRKNEIIVGFNRCEQTLTDLSKDKLRELVK